VGLGADQGHCQGRQQGRARQGGGGLHGGVLSLDHSVIGTLFIATEAVNMMICNATLLF
jgi:hypothetical protein